MSSVKWNLVVVSYSIVIIIRNMLLRYTEMGEHLSKHGDGAKDIAFEVEDLDAIFKVIYYIYITL